MLVSRGNKTELGYLVVAYIVFTPYARRQPPIRCDVV